MALHLGAKPAVIPTMNSTKSLEVIWGGRVSAAKINAEHARKHAIEAVRQADRAEAHAWSFRMEGLAGLASRPRRSPNAATLAMADWR